MYSSAENRIEKTLRLSSQLNNKEKEREDYSKVFRLGSMVDSNVKNGEKE